MKREELLSMIRWEVPDIKPKGGQHCGPLYNGVVLICDGMDIKIEIGYHRSQLRNKELAFQLFELLMMEVTK